MFVSRRPASARRRSAANQVVARSRITLLPAGPHFGTYELPEYTLPMTSKAATSSCHSSQQPAKLSSSRLHIARTIFQNTTGKVQAALTCSPKNHNPVPNGPVLAEERSSMHDAQGSAIERSVV